MALALGLLAGVCLFFWLTTELPAPDHLRARAALGSTRILDRHGKLLFELPDPLTGRQRPVPLSTIPLALRQATIAVEDASFYTNPGVDVRGILRAAWIDLRTGSLAAGGSTLTQQLARGFLLDPDLASQRSFTRKLREAVLALKLTAAYPKDEILALYLNQTYYGGMAYGVEAGARHVFGKPARDLDLAESALLAGLPQAPSRYDPLADPAAAKARQAEVLAAMARAGFITAAEADAAHAEPLQFATEISDYQNVVASSSVRSAARYGDMRAPHFVNYVLDQLSAELGADSVLRGGLTVTTTLDADLNDAAQSSLRRQIELLATPQRGGPDHRVRNGAVIVLNPADGSILAMVGSPNFADTRIQGQVNAALARRQPGSAIKPLTYAAALERGWTPATTILDAPASFPTREGRTYTPQNYDRAFHGPIALREALATSSNIGAVRVLQAIGVPALLEMAQRLGIASLGQDPSRFGLALTLGGGEVTPLELTVAYGAFANGGRRVAPHAVTDVADAQGRSLFGQRPNPGVDNNARSSLVVGPWSPQQVLSPQIAYLITDILSDRYARMRAFGAQSALDVDRPASAKTGTTSDWRDNWTVGYTPDRVVGVWVGNADGQPMEAISGISGAGPVWHEVMLAAHRGLPARAFARPDGIVELAICAEGGMLPGPNCPATRGERFVAGTEPAQPDTTHVAVAVDPMLGCRAPAGYPREHTVTRIFRILPAGAEVWAEAAGFPRIPQKFCPTEVAMGRTSEGATGHESAPPRPLDPSPVPALLSPAPGAVFAISPGVPRDRQQIRLQAQAGDDVIDLTILVDERPLSSFDGPPYRAFWTLAPGRHRAVVEARDSAGKTWRSDEIEFVVEGE
jgi:1A family penicillin-binding protein